MCEPCSPPNPVDIVGDASRSCVLNNPVHLKVKKFIKKLCPAILQKDTNFFRCTHMIDSTLSAVKSNVFFDKFKVKSNGKKSEVQRVLDFTFFKVKSNTCAPFPR